MKRRPRTILLAPIRTTQNVRHFVAYIYSPTGLHLLAPCDDEKEAAKIGMSYHDSDSGMPPYTIALSRPYQLVHLTAPLLAILKADGQKGTFQVFELHGYIQMENEIFTVTV